MEKVTEERTALQWHPAFFAGLQIELAEEAHHLSFESEHQLGTKPKEIDVLVIKKDSNVSIKKNIGRIFREHNIIEYKSPEDYLSIDAFYKVYGYACFYKADTKQVDEIKSKEITISYVSKKYPYKLIRHLEHELHKHENLYQSMMDIIINANEDAFREGQNMCEALLRISRENLKDEFAESEARGELIGKEKTLISLVKDGLLSVSEAAKRLSISEEELVKKMDTI